MRFKEIAFRILFLLPVFIINGCDVSENEVDCATDMALKFRFMANGRDLLGTEVSSLSVFIFDENDRFVGRWDEWDNSKFTSDYYMTLPLRPGIYSCVAWGGIDPAYYYVCHKGETAAQMTSPVVGETTREQLLARIKSDTRSYAGGNKLVVDNTASSMFHGSVLNTRLDQGNNIILIDLVKNTKDITLTILGMPLPTKANEFPHMQIYLETPNGGYQFDNALETPRDAIAYLIQNITGDKNSQRSTMRTLKLIFGNGNRLTIWNTETNQVFYSTDIIEDIIRKMAQYSTQDAVDKEDEFDIELDFSGGVNVAVGVKVNGWNVEGGSGTIQ